MSLIPKRIKKFALVIKPKKVKNYLSLSAALLCIILLSACHSLPEHAKYIPADASVVIGLNTNGLGKKVAWSAITGSKILDELKESAKDAKGKEALNDIEQSGIDFGSTIYFYAKPDKRFDNEMRMSIVAPIDDAKKWESYIKKVFPAAGISKVKERSEAMLDGKAYAAWTDDVLMISNTAVLESAPAIQAPATVDTAMAAADTDIEEPVDTGLAIADQVPTPTDTYTPPVILADTAMTAAEMDAAFALKSDASIKENKRFKKLDGDGHDISVFIATGALMDSYAGKGGADMGMMSGMMSGNLWKNTAMAAGIDFEKGKIAGIMHYYASDSMKEVAKAYGADNIDKDILSRVPSENLNLIAGYHLSPKATKLLLDKMNLSGMANLFLMQKGLSVDEILSAFTGDMVVAVNNFKIEQTAASYDSTIGVTVPAGNRQQSDFVFAMKLGKKESFQKLFGMATAEGGLQQTAPNVYTMPGADGTTLVVGQEFLAVSNKPASAQAFLQKGGGKVPEAAREAITGHPLGAFIDFSMMGGMNNNAMGITDPALADQLRKFFTNATISGGEYKSDANEYVMSLNLANKDENSLLQLMQLAQRIAAAKKKEGVALNN